MNKDQKTIKRIQELVPEILKRKSICKECNGDGFTVEHSTGVYDHDTDGSCNGSCPVQVQCEECKATGIIIGRDITLEDVLLALNKCNKEADCNYITMARRDYCENKNVVLINFKRDGNCVWQLNKPFQDQSQETKDFIGDLILSE